MATFTTDFLIGSHDGWVLVATNPSQLEIKPAVYHPWWVAITDSGSPAATLVGFPMGRDPSTRNETFVLTNGVTGLVYIRIALPTDSSSDEKMFFNVTATTAGSSGGGGTPGNVPVSQRAQQYETVAAGQSNQALGATGAVGDYLSHIVIEPTTTAAGTVVVKDGSTTVYTFTTGTLTDLKSLTVPFLANSVSGSWNVTTGTNVAVIGFGIFT